MWGCLRLRVTAPLLTKLTLLFFLISIYYMVGHIMSAIPYLAGRPLERPEPLSRFVPPIPEGVIAAWLQANLPPRTEISQSILVLDPFGASPRVAVEAARAG